MINNSEKYIINLPNKYIDNNSSSILLKNINKLSVYYNDIKYFKEFRKKAATVFFKLKKPDWIFFELFNINFNFFSYFSFINKKNVNIEYIIKDINIDNYLYNKTNMAVDFILDSFSIFSTLNNFLAKYGIIFFPLFFTSKKYTYLVKSYMGKVIPLNDNYFSNINSMFFSEGSFWYVPKYSNNLFEVSSYFRINNFKSAQFERTLLIISEKSKLLYLESWTAKKRIESQLHAAQVEIIVKKNSIVKYFTVQNWYEGTIYGLGRYL